MPALLGISLVSLPDPQRAQVSSSLYINDVNTNVLQPVGIPAAECEPPGAPGAASEMLSYPFPPDSTPGTDWGSSMSTCGAGGWELSADSVFSVVNDLATGNILLTAGQKQQMITDCLGWDCSVRTDCPNPSVGTGPYVCKNGNPGDSGVNPAGPACTQQYETMWTYAGILTNVPVVVFVNSPLPYPYTGNNSYNCPYTGDIIDLVRDAYCAAGVSGPPAPCQP
jgi:hypothetical protein